MFSKFKKFKDWLFNEKKDRILTPIGDEEDWNKKEKEWVKYSRGLEAQISKFQEKERKNKKEKKEFDSNIELIQELQKKQEKINKEENKPAYDLMNFFKKILKDKKFRESFEISDVNDEEVFDIFGTIKVMDNNDFAVVGKSGEIFARGKTIFDIIYKPNTLKNQVKRKRWLVPYDKNGMPKIDYEEIEMPEISYNEQTGEWNESEERLEPFKNLLMKRDIKIKELREDKKHKEQLITDLRERARVLELAEREWKNRAEVNKNELMLALENSKEITKELLSLDRKVAITEEQKQLSDDIKGKYETAFESVIEELEDEKSQTKARKIKDEVQRDVEWTIKASKKISPPGEESEIIPREYTKPKTKIGEKKSDTS